MKIFLGIKYFDDYRNRKLIEKLVFLLKKNSHKTYCTICDYQKWGAKKINYRNLMRRAYQEIISSDIVIIECSNKGVGLGVEAGIAFSSHIPVIAIIRGKKNIPESISGIAVKIFRYHRIEELSRSLIHYLQKHG